MLTLSHIIIDAIRRLPDIASSFDTLPASRAFDAFLRRLISYCHAGFVLSPLAIVAVTYCLFMPFRHISHIVTQLCHYR